jgi:hypothetical protein
MLREYDRNPEEIEEKCEDHVYEEVRYFLMSRPMKPRVKIRPDLNSFQAERRKLIKARAYASRHGVSLTDAYGRIR